ncbi:cysteine rich repeat-containing protein [Mesorhizobium sp. LHD-90]|uniref:cysteine rich repeat-containing protein n=1 Tax=Mesorhizobium sp. LHD-90 TaxID=3071414 RepID=UPI0027E1A370|nr:cysteine rich repeat-containing protein [Mesorhizobium sp. LHD-90]MDQ6436538.1 cysteine rich repeat-containing protein [Mesorhizobium sp. LHD-90]
MRAKINVVAIALALLAAGNAFAQTAAEREACAADYQKFCSDVAPGGGKILECLAKQKDQLSPACQKVVETHQK